MRLRIVKNILLVFTISVIFSQVQAQPGEKLYPKNVIISAGEKVNFKVQAPALVSANVKGYFYWWIYAQHPDSLAKPVDSLAVQYCICKSATLADTLALRSTALRNAVSYTGNVAAGTLDADFTYQPAKWYLMKIYMDGIPYLWIDFIITNSGSQATRLYMEEVAL